MFPFVVDYRYTMEPSLSLYHSTKATFRANTRGKPSKPSRLATTGMTTTSPTLASEFHGLTYSAKPTSASPSPPPYSAKPSKRKQLRSSMSSDVSDLSVISESEEDEVSRPHNLRRTSTAMSGVKKAMKLNFLRRKTSDSAA